MRHMQSVPWQVKIAAKIVLARLPFPYQFWEKIGLFKQGGMDRPEYALATFRRHFDGIQFARKADDFVGLELGPGDSLCSALIARTLGASRTFLVDAEFCASTNLNVYRAMEAHLRALGLHPPSLDHCSTMDDISEAIGAEYLTDGARSIPCHTASASAICGIASGRTNDTASIRCTPVADSRSISWIFASVGTGSSFCSPSRGPTSRTEIRSGRSLTASSPHKQAE